MSVPTALKLTPLNAVHRRLGARMVDFGGWDMPVQYSGILDEHNAVRTAVGVFDVSHMGEIEIRGPEALELVDFVSTNSAAKLAPGKIQYAGLLYDHGGFVDDILVHRVSEDSFFLCVNASNQEKDFEHIRAANRWRAEGDFAGDRFAQIAIQGPLALATLQKLTSTPLAGIRYYNFVDGEAAGVAARIARTGYTGEDGFEIYIDPAAAEKAWDAIFEAGAEFGIKPCGLGARNTLRMEAARPLYGHEIHASITPFDAGLDWIVKMEKESFLGRAALERQRQAGTTRKLVGFEMRGRGIARDRYEEFIGGPAAGRATTGGPSPTPAKNIGFFSLPVASAVVGQPIRILIRGQLVDAVTIPTPFYKRAR